MRAVVWQGPDRIALVERPVPGTGGEASGEVLVHVEQIGVCGSDLEIIRGHNPAVTPGTILGHEFSGHVVQDSGPRVAGARVTVRPHVTCVDRQADPCRACSDGDSAVCSRASVFGVDVDGGMAEFVRVNAANVYAVDPSTPPGLDVFAEPLAVAVRAVRRAGPTEGRRVVVFGGGTIGLLCATIAVRLHAAAVLVVEPNEQRGALGRELGLDVVAPDTQLAAHVRRRLGASADVVIEASGHVSAVPAMLRVLRSSGVAVVVGIHDKLRQVDLRALCLREQSIVGSCMYDEQDFCSAVGLLAGDRLGLMSLAMERVDIDDAVRKLTGTGTGTGTGSAIKTVILPRTDRRQ